MVNERAGVTDSHAASGKTCGAWRALRSDRARRTLRTCGAWRALRSGRAHWSIKSGRAHWSIKSGRTGNSRHSPDSTRTGDSLESLKARKATRTSLSCCPGGSGSPAGSRGNETLGQLGYRSLGGCDGTVRPSVTSHQQSQDGHEQ